MKHLLISATLFASVTFAGGVTVRFDPSTPAVGPYPTNALTVADAAQLTGRRINLPLPDCAAEPSTCAELNNVNQLDGFSIRPRIRVRFSGPIDPNTLVKGIFLVPLGGPAKPGYGAQYGTPIPINTVMYDPKTDTAYAEPDQVLDQGARYALIVTGGVRDLAGDPVQADPALINSHWQAGDYFDELWVALWPLAFTNRFHPDWIAGASVFTTLSATSWMEKARAAIQSSPINLSVNSPNGGFRTSQLSGITLHAQTGLKPVAFKDIDTWPVDDLAGVDQIAFGSYTSPQFLSGGLFIPAKPTAADVPLPAASAKIFFHAYLPPGPAPSQGYPVVIVGHGYPDGRFRQPPSIASSLASAGFASIAIDAVGHGYGPQSTLLINSKDGTTTELPAAGRGVDFDGNGKLDQGEGCYLYAGSQVIIGRDCWRQTALDLMQLVRAIKAGMDLTGSGRPELDGSRIFYVATPWVPITVRF